MTYDRAEAGRAETVTAPADGAQITHRAMGTVMTHRAFGPYAEHGLNAVCREVARIEALLSRFLPDSDISRLNRSAGDAPQSVSLETYDVLSTALELSRALGGALAVTIAPLVALWSRATSSRTPPPDSDIRRVLPLVDDRDLVLDPWNVTARLRRAEQSVDLGGLGKGYAADRIRTVCDICGVRSAYANLGGNVVTVGARPDGSPWQIGIQHPRRPDGLIGAVAVFGETVVTSGDYQRCFTDSRGSRYHHILDPATGYPAASGLISVTIVAGESFVADALSTAVFVAGLESGLALLRAFPEAGAVLVDADLNVFVTRALQDRFHTDDGIRMTVLD